MPKFTKETTLSELLQNPKTAEILAKFNVPCLGCPMAQQEMENLKIGEVCKMYKIDLISILKELNKL